MKLKTNPITQVSIMNHPCSELFQGDSMPLKGTPPFPDSKFSRFSFFIFCDQYIDLNALYPLSTLWELKTHILYIKKLEKNHKICWKNQKSQISLHFSRNQFFGYQKKVSPPFSPPFHVRSGWKFFWWDFNWFGLNVFFFFGYLLPIKFGRLRKIFRIQKT